MFCWKCGKEIEINGKFCPHCGNVVDQCSAVPSTRNGADSQKVEKKSALKVVICGSLALLLFVAGMLIGGKLLAKDDGETVVAAKEETAQNETDTEETEPALEEKAYKVEGAGFGDPKEAVNAYLEALKAGDVEAMISTFAVETFVDNYDVAAMYDRLNSVHFSSASQQFRSENAYTRNVNLINRIGSLGEEFAWQYAVLTGADLDELSLPIVLGRSEYMDGTSFLDSFMDPNWMENLSGIYVNGVYELTELDEITPEEKEILARNDQIRRPSIGYDEVRHMFASFSYSGQDYYFAADIARYGDAWYLLGTGGTAGSWLGMSALNGGIILQSEAR